MKKSVLLALLIGSSFSFSAFAGKAFKCMGDKSRFEVIEGWYSGEGADTITLKSSSIYGIYNKEDYGRPLTLERDRDTNRTRGLLKNYPIQFVAKQRDNLGASTTVFAIDLGVFGGNVGKQFQAVLATDGQHLLGCEIVQSVNLR